MLWYKSPFQTAAGMVHNTARVSRQQAAALGMLSSEEGLAAMHSLLGAQHAQQAAVVGAVRPAYWLGLLAKVQQVPHLYSELSIRPASGAQEALMDSSAAAAVQQPQPAAATLPSSWSPAAVEAAVKQLVAAVLGVEGADPDAPLAAQGLDSLAGLELRQKVQVRDSSHCLCIRNGFVHVGSIAGAMQGW